MRVINLGRPELKSLAGISHLLKPVINFAGRDFSIGFDFILRRWRRAHLFQKRPPISRVRLGARGKKTTKIISIILCQMNKRFTKKRVAFFKVITERPGPGVLLIVQFCPGDMFYKLK